MCLAHAILAKPLLASGPQSLALSSNFTEFGASVNQSVSLLNTSANNAINVECDGGKYGFLPDVTDCRSVRDTMMPGETEFVFLDREDEPPAGTSDPLPLPVRLMGGMSDSCGNPNPSPRNCDF